MSAAIGGGGPPGSRAASRVSSSLLIPMTHILSAQLFMPFLVSQTAFRILEPLEIRWLLFFRSGPWNPSESKLPELSPSSWPHQLPSEVVLSSETVDIPENVPTTLKDTLWLWRSLEEPREGTSVHWRRAQSPWEEEEAPVGGRRGRSRAGYRGHSLQARTGMAEGRAWLSATGRGPCVLPRQSCRSGERLSCFTLETEYCRANTTSVGFGGGQVLLVRYPGHREMS